MRKSFFGGVFLISLHAFSQGSQPPPSIPAIGTTPMSAVPNQELFKDRSKIYFYDEFYIIDGRKVVGTPFLYHDWLNGSVTTADGRVFNGYRLKYNAFQQTIYFHNGIDSLEVDDPVRSFILILPSGDTNSVFTFINSSQIKEEKKPMYYELLLENPTWQLLKFNRKFVAEASKTLPVAEGRKVFDLEVSYYIFNKSTKKLTRLKASGTNIASTLALNKEQEADLVNYDFSAESDILRYFQKYFSESH
jgi:hypothetical protein